MRDIFFLVADKNMQAVFSTFLTRDGFHHRIGCGEFDFDPQLDIQRHPRKDSGVFNEAGVFLRPFRSTHRRAVVVIDVDWSGSPGAEQIKQGIEVQLASDWDEYPSHISMLFDVFPAEAVSAGKYNPEESGSPVYGLLQDFVLDYTDDGEIVAWTRQPRHGLAASICGAEAISDLLSSLPTVFSAATATVATGQTAVSNRPQVTLALDNEDRALIHQVHEISDWVFTVDRNIGIEYFDHNDQGSRPDYLIEHTPSIENGLGHQVLVTSRSLVEVEAMMRSVLKTYSLPSHGGRSAAILDNLRCLSGRSLHLVREIHGRIVFWGRDEDPVSTACDSARWWHKDSGRKLNAERFRFRAFSSFGKCGATRIAGIASDKIRIGRGSSVSTQRRICTRVSSVSWPRRVWRMATD
jgi:hypothetical protein